VVNGGELGGAKVFFGLLLSISIDEGEEDVYISDFEGLRYLYE